MLQRAASNAYSWWWASHIRTKQSKWLDNNLQDMEEKVQSMLNLIQEDADSFAQKAEMYYRKRPELINFVEESYRAYRALAERYEHISGELHKANNTIATVFPDQVQFPMEDEEDDNSPKATTIDSSKFHKVLLPGKTQASLTNKDIICPSAPKRSRPKGAGSHQMDKDKAQEEIDKLQKGILVLQTEKEFIKSSYESGLAKYWDIEKRITKMQQEVCCLQDDFSVSMVIEDDEARALMAATALKSCEDTLINLQEQQKRSAEEAKVESERIEDAKVKLKVLKGAHVQPRMEDQDLHNEATESSSAIMRPEEEFCIQKHERLEIQSICEKVKQHFEMNSDTSAVELAEKIDELVNKVLTLEVTASSQAAQIRRLRLETNELQKHLKSLEEDNTTLTDDSKCLSDKLRDAEEELRRVQDLDKCVRDGNQKLQTYFTEACHNFNNLSEKLQSTEEQDELHLVGSNQEVEIVHSSELEGECKEEEDMKAPADETNNLKHDLIDEVDPAGSSQEVEIVHSSELQGECKEQADETNNSKHDLIDEVDPAGSNQEVEIVHSIVLQKESKEQEDMTDPADKMNDSKNDLIVEVDPAGSNQEAEIVHSSVLQKECEEQEDMSDPADKMNNSKNDLIVEVDLAGSNQEVEIVHSSLLQKECKEEDMEAPADEMNNSKSDFTEEETCVIQEPSLCIKDQENNIHSEACCVPDDVTGKLEEPKQEGEIKKMDSTQEDNGSDLNNDQLTENAEQEDSPIWRKLFLNGLEDKEKILLAEYTSILRNFKDTKRKLLETEKKNQEYFFETTAQIRDLTNANVMKDEEIRSLRQKLNFLETSCDENLDVHLAESKGSQHHRLESTASREASWFSPSFDDRSDLPNYGTPNDKNVESMAAIDESREEAAVEKLHHIDEPQSTSAIEEKIRRDIDELLEENLEFWLRFSSSFHQIQKFQTAIQDLQAEILNPKDNKKQEGSNAASGEQSVKPEATPVYKRLTDLQNDLSVWLEQNALLKAELQCRFSSLCNIKEEISSVSKGPETGEAQLTAYQAAKFRGEVLNMQQENNKVADELQAGLDHVKGLQAEVEKSLARLHGNFELSGSRGHQHHYYFRHFSSRTRIPLRSFLFGAKPKKPSIFSCMNPALQKQYSDLTSRLPT